MRQVASTRASIHYVATASYLSWRQYHRVKSIFSRIRRNQHSRTSAIDKGAKPLSTARGKNTRNTKPGRTQDPDTDGGGKAHHRAADAREPAHVSGHRPGTPREETDAQASSSTETSVLHGRQPIPVRGPVVGQGPLRASPQISMVTPKNYDWTIHWITQVINRCSDFDDKKYSHFDSKIFIFLCIHGTSIRLPIT